MSRSSLSSSPTRVSSSSSSPSPGRESLELERLNKEAVEETLPTTEQPLPRGPQLHPAFYIAAWIFFSNSTILFNKWILDTQGFRFPAVLTTMHLAFSVLTTQLLSRFVPSLLNPKSVRMTGRIYLRNIVPIGILYSFSLVCSNLVYLYLSVAYIQMLKSAAPVVVLFVSWLWGVASPSLRKLINVLVITAGIALTTAGELQFSILGFMFQFAGTIFEALRIVMIEVLVNGKRGIDDEPGLPKMDPLLTLYYYAPVCMVTNFLVACVFESSTFQLQDLSRIGPFMLFASAIVAFMLNVASVFLIGRTSAVVQCLTGIFKNVLLVFLSMFLWGTTITVLQWFGYIIALLGLVYYSLGPDGTHDLINNIRTATDFYGGRMVAEKIGGMWSANEDLVSSRMNKRLLYGILGIIVVAMVMGVILIGGSESGFDILAMPGGR